MDLLSLLNENARLTNAQLAVMLGKTEEEVEKEIADYQQKGIIKGYKALINWEKVDHHKTTALIELKVQPKKESGFDEIAKKLCSSVKWKACTLCQAALIWLLWCMETAFRILPCLLQKDFPHWIRFFPQQLILS